MTDIQIPQKILNDALINWGTAEADRWNPNSPTFQPYDPFGRVLYWLWSEGHEKQAALLIFHYAYGLEVKGHGKLTDSKFKADVVYGIRVSVFPDDLEDKELARLYDVGMNLP